jgi:hypothetical protein
VNDSWKILLTTNERELLERAIGSNTGHDADGEWHCCVVCMVHADIDKPLEHEEGCAIALMLLFAERMVGCRAGARRER